MVSLTKKPAVGAAAEGIAEGDYMSWSFQWKHEFTTMNSSQVHNTITFIDDKNDLIYLEWKDTSGNFRLSIYDLTDGSPVFESLAAQNYGGHGYLMHVAALLGMSSLNSGGSSRSLQTYLMITRDWGSEIEVWRNGAVLWNHDVTVNEAGSTLLWVGEISPTGRWICFVSNSLFLTVYEGSET